MFGLTIDWDLGFTHIDKLFLKSDNDLTMIWGFQGVLLINGPLCYDEWKTFGQDHPACMIKALTSIVWKLFMFQELELSSNNDNWNPPT